MFKLIIYGFILVLLSSTTVYIFLTSKNATVSSIKLDSIGKMTTTIMHDLDKALPLIEKAGYKISTVEAELSVPPEITTIFELVNNVDRKKQEQILKSLEGNKIGVLVLSSLMKSFALNKEMAIKRMKLKMIHVTIALPPYITLEYEK